MLCNKKAAASDVLRLKTRKSGIFEKIKRLLEREQISRLQIAHFLPARADLKEPSVVVFLLEKNSKLQKASKHFGSLENLFFSRNFKNTCFRRSLEDSLLVLLRSAQSYGQQQNYGCIFLERPTNKM